MKLYNSKARELNDTTIVELLEESKQDYENGNIVECRLTLEKICRAIKQFEKDVSE